MAQDKFLFQKTQDYEEFLQHVNEHLPHTSKYYFYSENLEQALTSINTKDEETRKRILNFANYVDKKLNLGGQAHKNRYHKIPTVLAGAIYLDLYPDKIENLALEEFIILAKHAITLPIMFYKTGTMYYTKELLALIHRIGADYMYHSTYMFLTEKYFNMGKTSEEVTEYFKSTDPKDLLEEAFEYERQLQIEYEEEVAKYESRRV